MFTKESVNELSNLLELLSKNSYDFDKITLQEMHEKNKALRLYMLDNESQPKNNLSFFIYPNGNITYAFFGPINSMLHEKPFDVKNDNIKPLLDEIN